MVGRGRKIRVRYDLTCSPLSKRLERLVSNMALQCTYSHCRDDSLISEIVSHVSWIWCRLGWTRNCITSSEGGYNGQSITTQRQAKVSLNWWLKMTLTWGSWVCLVIVEETCYERRQRSKIKATVLQCFAGSSLLVHYPLFFVHKSQIVTS